MASRLLPLLMAGAIAGCGGAAADDDELHAAPGADATHAKRADGRAAVARGGSRTEAGGGSAHVLGASAASSRAWMPDAPRKRALVWAVGDGPGGRASERVAALIARSRPDRVLYLGDVYERGSAQDYRRGYASGWGRLAPITAPTPGNHEWPNRAEGYDAHWRRVRGASPPDSYAFRAGGWRILALNSETDRRTAQLAWLRTQLRARGDCAIAFWHRPRYSAGPHGNSTAMRAAWDALQGEARIVLGAHDHNMQRFRRRGTLTEFVSGAGGRGHYRLDRTRDGLAFGDDDHYGALRLDLRPGSARLSFVATSGRTLDTTRVGCHR